MHDSHPQTAARGNPAKALKGAAAGFGCWPSRAAILLAVVLAALTGLPAAAAEKVGEDEPADTRRLTELDAAEEGEGPIESGGRSPTEFELAGVRARLNGLLEVNFELLDVSDEGDRDSHRSTDFFVSSIGIALRLFFNEWSKAKIAVAAEDVGRDDGSDKILLDEAVAEVKFPGTPLYLMAGKMVMPFGAFEDHLISGTLAEDLYEIDTWGATIGLKLGTPRADISFSLYRDPEVTENLRNFNSDAYRPTREKDHRFQSFAVSAALGPYAEVLTARAFYDSEPGTGRRNRSVGGALTAEAVGLSLDLKYIAALTREKSENGEENKESAWTLGLSFDLLESLELAARWEVFLDDDIGRQDEVLDYRLVAGFNYAFLEYATFSFEYGYLKFEREKGSGAADRQKTFQFQLALEF